MYATSILEGHQQYSCHKDSSRPVHLWIDVDPSDLSSLDLLIRPLMPWVRSITLHDITKHSFVNAESWEPFEWMGHTIVTDAQDVNKDFDATIRVRSSQVPSVSEFVSLRNTMSNKWIAPL